MAALSGGTRVPAPRPICLRLGRKIRYSTRFIPLAPVGVKGKLTRLWRARALHLRCPSTQRPCWGCRRRPAGRQSPTRAFAEDL